MKRNLLVILCIMSLLITGINPKWSAAKSGSKIDKNDSVCTLNMAKYEKSVMKNANKNGSARKVTPVGKVIVLKKGLKYKLNAKQSTKLKVTGKKILKIAKNKIIVAKKKGKTTIKAGSKKYTVIVGTPVKDIVVKNKTLKVKKGGNLKLKTSIKPKKPSVSKLMYKSLDKSVASVSKTGVVTGKKDGIANIVIYASDGSGVSKVVKIFVGEIVKITDIELKDVPEEIEVGNTYTLNPEIVPSNATIKQLIYSSSNEAVATVSDKGEVKALSPGVVTITMKSTDTSDVKKSVSFSMYESVKVQSDSEDKDSDGDKLSDYYEKAIATDKLKADTDGDGLLDGYEDNILGTSPKAADSDSNGINDNMEDFDGDGLTNYDKYLYGCNPFVTDSDEDGISDSDEINIYYTNPLLKDTDKDGLNDSDEISANLDPTRPDTDGDGVMDGKEYLTQSVDIDNSELVTGSAISNMTLNVTAEGCSTENIHIYNGDNQIQAKQMQGIVADPVTFVSDKSFQKAQIKIKYDESALGTCDESNLALVWYDEANNWYQILESSVDTSDNVVSYTTTHFSTYMLVDKTFWYKTWRDNIDYRDTSNVSAQKNYNISYVVDVSGSMSSDNKMNTTKTALKNFFATMSENDDASLVTFNSYGKVLVPFGNVGQADSSDLLSSSLLSVSPYVTYINAVNSLTANGGTYVESGLKAAITEFDNTSNRSLENIMVLLCNGDVEYTEETLDVAVEKNIKIYTIDIGVETSNEDLEYIADKTSVEFYYCSTTAEIETVFGNIQGNTTQQINTTDTDTDGDGLYDVYETRGIKTTSGEIIYTDPNTADTDGDGLSDYDEIGFIYNMPMPEAFSSKSLSHEFDFGLSSTYCMQCVYLKSDPTKADTDGDGLLDPDDPYPWHNYCGGANASQTWQHNNFKLSSDKKTYVCQKCGYAFANPCEEDKEKMSGNEYGTRNVYVNMIAYYTALRIAKYGKNSSECINEKLLWNGITDLRQDSLYNSKYQYSDINGDCIGSKFNVDGKCKLTFEENEVGLNKGFYDGTYLTVAGAAFGDIGLICTLVGVGTNYQAGNDPTWMDIISGATAIPGIESEFYKNLGLMVAGGIFSVGVANDTISSEDTEKHVYLYRGGTGGLAHESIGLYVTGATGEIEYQEIAEYGHCNSVE